MGMFAQAMGEQLATALQSERLAVAADESSRETAE
jgi:hypothetical protein